MRIRTRLLLLSLAVLVPALVGAAIGIGYVYQEQRELHRENLRETARALALVLDRELGERETVLKVLAASPALAAGDLRAFYDHARALVDQSHTTVILSDLDGRQLLNTRLPLEAPLAPGQPMQPGGESQFGDTVARDLVNALIDLLNVQNDFLSVWVDHEVQRLRLDFELGTMELDPNGLRIEHEQPLRTFLANLPNTVPFELPDACGDGGLCAAQGGRAAEVSPPPTIQQPPEMFPDQTPESLPEAAPQNGPALQYPAGIESEPPLLPPPPQGAMPPGEPQSAVRHPAGGSNVELTAALAPVNGTPLAGVVKAIAGEPIPAPMRLPTAKNAEP